MFRTKRIPFVLLLFLVVECAAGLAQTAAGLVPKVRITKDTAYISCCDDPFGSRFVRSPVLRSPDGLYKAYVEVRAKALVSPEEHYKVDRHCENVSKLYLAGSADRNFRVVFMIKPDDKHDGNSLKLIDWSPDGRFLLVEFQGWRSHSDMVGAGIMLLYPRTRRVSRVHSYEPFTRYFGRSCDPTVRVVGIGSDGFPVLRASPDEEWDNDCVKKEGLWLFDPEKKTVRRLPKGYQIQHFGKWEELSPRKPSATAAK